MVHVPQHQSAFLLMCHVILSALECSVIVNVMLGLFVLFSFTFVAAASWEEGPAEQVESSTELAVYLGDQWCSRRRSQGHENYISTHLIP